jgi:DnaJ-domain-containing protein 1
MDPVRQLTVESGNEMLEDYKPGVIQEQLLRVLRCSKDTYYKILKLDENALEDNIKQAYRRISKIVHPDRNKDIHAKKAFQSKETSQ